MNGSVSMNGNTLLSGGLTVNTDGVVEPIDINITENGDRTITAHAGVDGYNPITIHANVPQQTDPVLDDITITENGNYTPPSGTDGYNDITVNVPQQSAPVLDDITIIENGTYTPPTGVDGYNEVNVNVPIPTPVIESKSITENGTYTAPYGVNGYSPITVNVSGYTIKTQPNTPTPIATFSDGTDNPLKSLTASIVPMQSGSGDPSPTNVRPISGWTETVIGVRGVNQWDEEWEIISNTLYSKNYIPVKPSTQYYMTPHQGRDYRCFDKDYNEVKTWTWLSPSYTSFTTPSNCYYIKFRMTTAYGTTYNNDISINYPSTDTEYHAYSGTTITIPFTDSQGSPVEVYGGSVDVVNAIVTPAPYYASYNGESLTGEWISDRDVYSPNTTPTIGAQVVNIGATDTPFSVQPTSIKSLDGVNNVFASTGDVEELKYFADL